MRVRGNNPIYGRYNERYSNVESSDYTATYGGVMRKTILLLMLTGLVAYYIGTTVTLTTGSLIGMLLIAPLFAWIMVILAHRNLNLSFMFSILYALAEGAVLGLLSMLIASYTPGPIIEYALVGTFSTVFVMLLVYMSGIIKIGERFRGFLYTAFGTLFLLFFIYIIGSLFGGFGGLGGLTFYMTIIVFSIIVSVLYLLHDFEQVKTMVQAGVDKRYEWSLSLGLIVVIVWLYIDILRLLAILMNRD